MKVGSPLMKNVLKPLAKSVFIPLRLKAAESAADARIYKKIIDLVNHNIDKSKRRNGRYHEHS